YSAVCRGPCHSNLRLQRWRVRARWPRRVVNIRWCCGSRSAHPPERPSTVCVSWTITGCGPASSPRPRRPADAPRHSGGRWVRADGRCWVAGPAEVRRGGRSRGADLGRSVVLLLGRRTPSDAAPWTANARFRGKIVVLAAELSVRRRGGRTTQPLAVRCPGAPPIDAVAPPNNAVTQPEN